MSFWISLWIYQVGCAPQLQNGCAHPDCWFLRSACTHLELCYWNATATYFAEKASLPMSPHLTHWRDLQSNFFATVLWNEINPHNQCFVFATWSRICFSWVKGLLHLPIWDRAAWTSVSATLVWVCAPHSSIKWVAATCKTDEGRRSAHIRAKKELTPAYATILQVCAGSNNICQAATT